ncbi:MAG TPA: hypothetical protein VJV78_21870 [Polyangiales bacterium]|nr:hypothetical protein [Polyangiales bacterium]
MEAAGVGRRTLYFNAKAFKRSHRAGSTGNYYDADIEAGVVDEYLQLIGADQLDLTRFQVFQAVATDVEDFHERENRSLRK